MRTWALACFAPGSSATSTAASCPRCARLHTGGQSLQSLAEYRSLYVGIEKGYGSDLIKWDTRDVLMRELAKRLAAINLDRKLIAGSADAVVYFGKAQLRKEAVFFSYSGEAAPLFQETIQYLRLYNYETIEAAIDEIVTRVARVEKAA